MLIYPAIIIALVMLYQRTQATNKNVMKTHKCLQGKHNYKPGHGNFPSFKNKGFAMLFSIPKTAWFDPTENGPIGRDGKDWNKVGGVSFINPFQPKTWRKNASSAMIAWRPSERTGLFEVCAYTNDKSRKGTLSPIQTVKAGEVVGVTCNIGRRSVKYYLQGWEAEHKINRTRICVPVGPWFGGNRKSPITHTITTDFDLK